MEAQKKEKPDSTLTSAVRDGNVDKGAEGPSLAQNTQGNEAPKEKKTDEGQQKQEQVPRLNKTPKEKREEEAQEQEKKREQEQKQEQKQQQEYEMSWW